MHASHKTRDYTRRRFFLESGRAASGSWLLLRLPLAAALLNCARDDSPSTGGFERLNPQETRAMRAFAAQIIPSDEAPSGADELHAVRFLDHALGTPLFAAAAPVIHDGLADLDNRARAKGARHGFAALTSGEQIAVMKQIEHTPFFASARAIVVMGTFADPKYGGNPDAAGWRMIGLDHQPSYTTPFGWYDAWQDAAAAGSE